MAQYLFILGRNDELAFHELQIVLHRCLANDSFSLDRIKHAALVNTEESLKTDELINILGGTVKIALVKKAVAIPQFEKTLFDLLKQESTGKSKLLFGVSVVNASDQYHPVFLSKEFKKKLQQQGITSRYLLAKKGTELTSAQVKLTGLSEFYLIFSGSQVLIANTLALQDFQSFSDRDYKRPFIDPKGGMLPPKVARMMLNLSFTSPLTNELWVLDPFCGTATIALEAMILGLNSINSDLSQEKVNGAKANLTWLSQSLKRSQRWEVYQSDATKICSKITKPVDCIVTEPYLGPPELKVDKLDDLIKGLNKLYLGALKNWRICLKKKGRVVIVLPKYIIKGNQKSATLVIDRRENVGYTLVAGPFEYTRDKTTIRRLIYILERN